MRSNIPSSSWTIVNWLLAGCVFLGVLSVAGCSLMSPPAPQAGAPVDGGRRADGDADTAGIPTDPNFASVDSSGETRPPSVNVFGEFDGVESGAAAGTGDAGFQQHTFLDEGFDSDVTCDPSGKMIVFASTRHSIHPNIYLQRVDGMSVTQLTNDDADHAYPAFSPDGKQIAFCSTRSGSWNIYIMDTDGRNVTQVTSGMSQDLHPSFSPDGNRLVYCSLGGHTGQWELWTVDLTTGEKRMVGFGLFPSWSPARDGDHIAFQRARQRGSRWFSLWTLDLVDGEARHVSEVAVSTNAAIVSPAWSPDGQKLTFATIVEPARTNGVKPLGQQDIWTISADGSNRHRVTDGNGRNLTPYWGPENRIFFVSDRSGCECIWSVRVEAPRPLVDAGPRDSGGEGMGTGASGSSASGPAISGPAAVSGAPMGSGSQASAGVSAGAGVSGVSAGASASPAVAGPGAAGGAGSGSAGSGVGTSGGTSGGASGASVPAGKGGDFVGQTDPGAGDQ